jgi:threonine aldolase
VSTARGFASDNAATIHPEVLAAIARVNVGHAFGYGHDEYTQRVEALVAEQFGGDARAFFVFNGTGANVLSIRATCQPWQAVICADTAHMNADECGAPEHIAGVKLLTVAGQDGKLTPDAIERRIVRVGDEHAVQPRLISISQSTELGTLYSIRETAALAKLAHAHGMLLHIDGARLSNAAAALAVPLRALTTDVGVDVVSFGGTKNGLLAAEAVVFRDAQAAADVAYLRKQSLQLASKMRFFAAQFEALLTDELWRRCAEHANAMAKRLATALRDVGGLTVTRTVHCNAVFATIPKKARIELQDEFAFYVWDEGIGEVRWMCSWDTTAQDIDVFSDAVHAALS